MDDRLKVNFVVTLEMKLRKHLISQNDAGVRDYIIAIRVLWPKMSEIPISMVLFKKAVIFLKSQGWYMHLGEEHSKRINSYVTRTR
jgi:hypothetical protein